MERDSAPAGGPGVEEEGDSLDTLAERLRMSLEQTPCQVEDLRFFDARWFAACGAAGVWVIEGQPEPARLDEAVPSEEQDGPTGSKSSPQDTESADIVLAPVDEPPLNYLKVGQRSYLISERRILGGRALALLVRDGVLIAVVRHGGQKEREVLLAGEREASRAEAPAPPVSVHQDLGDGAGFHPTYGNVVSRKGLHVIVDWGRAEGLGRGDRVEFVTQEGHVVGKVVEVGDETARVRVGIGEPRPKKGDPARSTYREPTRKIVYQRQVPHRGEASVHLRYLVNAAYWHRGQSGVFSMDADAYVRWGLLRLGAILEPLAFADTLTYQFAGGAGIHTSPFGADLWLGSVSINDQLDQPPGTALSFGAGLRGGSEDGLHVTTRVLFAVHRQQLLVADVRGKVEVPFGYNRWIFVRGGGGPLGLALAELGVRFMVVGDGGAGSVFLRGTAGVMGTFTNYIDLDGKVEDFGPQTSGPAFGLGGSWRF